MVVKKDIWVFAYGSLMWRPGFEYLEARKAVLEGYHRDLCILSYVFRGTPAVPGLVLGLNPTGHCVGVVFRIAGAQVETVMEYLDEREMINQVYKPCWVDVMDEGGQTLHAYTFVAQANHPQFAGHFDLQKKIDYILQGVGQAGRALEYLENTCSHLRELDIVDPGLQAILKAAKDQDGQKTS